MRTKKTIRSEEKAYERFQNGYYDNKPIPEGVLRQINKHLKDINQPSINQNGQQIRRKKQQKITKKQKQKANLIQIAKTIPNKFGYVYYRPKTHNKRRKNMQFEVKMIHVYTTNLQSPFSASDSPLLRKLIGNSLPDFHAQKQYKLIKAIVILHFVDGFQQSVSSYLHSRQNKAAIESEILDSKAYSKHNDIESYDVIYQWY